MYEPVLTDEKLDLYNVYEVHKNYRILAMAVNVPLQVAEEICHILNEFEIKSLQPCPKCGYQPIIRELPNGGYKIVCRVCDLTTGLFNHKQNLINYWNTAICEEAVRYLQMDYESIFDTDSTLHQLLRKAGKLYRSEEEAKRYLDKDYKDLIIQEEE